jgi:FHS family L-fucose permease-like MFS transporter
MAQLQSSGNASIKGNSGAPANYLIPLALVTSLFFLWGFAISMLDVLNKHFQDLLGLTKSESAWVQVCTYGAYFFMALPAGYFMKKYGYKKGILAGLLLYAGGALLVYPAGEVQSWPFFLIALFILACGLAFLETAANPYATVLGPRETSEQRLNMAQSFNGLGVIIGPLVGGVLVFAEKSDSIEAGFDSVQLPYIIVGFLVLFVAGLFVITPMPEIEEEVLVEDTSGHVGKSLFQHKHFVLGAIAQLLNVGAQGCTWGFFINYATEIMSISDKDASYLLSVGMVIFMVGRFGGTVLMRYLKANTLLGIYGTAISLLLLVVTFNAVGEYSIYALMAFFFFQSITFPTIFALGVKDMGKYTKQASSYIIMGIVGGALFPPIMGAIADASSIPFSFILPVVLFAYIAWYGFKGSQLR